VGAFNDIATKTLANLLKGNSLNKTANNAAPAPETDDTITETSQIEKVASLLHEHGEFLEELSSGASQ